MTAGEGTLAAILKRQSLVVLAALAALTVLAWADLVWMAHAMAMPDMTAMSSMANMPGMAMAPGFAPWTLAHFLSMFLMWAVMMVGMMTPSAAPMILLYGRVAAHARASGRDFSSAMWFALGYLACWVVFAALATAAQYGLERLALLTPAMASANRIFGGAVLIAAGIYQWAPLKDSCLAHCRAPLAFVQHHGGFRTGVAASLRLGVLHGAYCIGCCGALMALLFVVGVMNLFWIALLMVFVLAEKVIPGGRILARVAGVAAVLAGAWLILG